MQWQEFRTHIRHISAPGLKRIEKAFALGQKLHAGQQRKSGDPYFIHPIAVALMLSELRADADTLIAALLHDTVEDTPLTIAEVDHLFNGSVAALIDGVTKLSADDFSMYPDLNEQVETLRKMFTLMQEDVRIILIKLTDRLHNMQTAEYLKPERQITLAEETREVYVKIADKLSMRDLRDELEALCLGILEPEIFRQLSELRSTSEERGLSTIESMQQSIREHSPQLSAHIQISFEHKSWERLRSQLSIGSTAVTGLSAITATIVCDDVEQAYQVLGVLHQLWRNEALSVHDFINTPHLNGYHGLHTTIITPDGTRIRCKIRTREMQEYAHRGVATMCFSGEPNLSHILPWTARIAPLASDTTGKSEDFWQSLKSDILGETLTIYGPGGSSTQIPKQSTALDAAFYLLREEALKTTAIKIDGTAVPLDAPLKQAVSLEFTLEKHQVMDHGWLTIVHTGFATAIIRHSLSAHSDRSKISIGKVALQRVLSSHEKGLLDELNPASLSSVLSSLGFGSLADAYIAIAEGRRKAENIYTSLFGSRRNRSETSGRTTYRFHFTITQDSLPALKQLIGMGQQCDLDWPSLRVRHSEAILHVSGNVAATPQELEVLKQELRWAGASNLATATSSRTEFLLTTIVILLWGLHPVLAKWLILRGIPPMMLVSFRLITFGFLATFLFLGWSIIAKKRFSFLPIPHLIRLAILPSLVTVALSIFTYNALVSMPSSLHLTILRFNVLLLPVLHVLHRMKSWTIAGIAILITTVSAVFLALIQPAMLSWGVTLSLCSLCAYGLYSFLIDHALHRYKIGFRYPALLCSSGVLQGISGLLLLFLGYWHALPLMDMALLILCMTVCVFIPHTFYYMLLNKRQTKNVADLFFLEPPIAIIAEMLLLGIFLPYWMYGIIVAALISIYLIRRMQKSGVAE